MLRFATRRRASRGDGSRWRKAKTVSVALEVPSAVSLVKQRAKTELFAAIDKDRSGAINHDEFLIFFLPIAPDHNSIIEWWTALAASSPASDCNEAAFVRWAENCPAQFEAAKQLVDRAAIARPREAQQLDSLLVSFEGAALVEDGSELGELGNVVAKLLVRLVDGRQGFIGRLTARGQPVKVGDRVVLVRDVVGAHEGQRGRLVKDDRDMKPFTVEFDDGKMSDYLRKEDVKKDEWAALHARLWFETTAYPASDFAWIDGQFVLASVVRGSTVLKCQLRLKPTRFMPRRGSIWGMRILAPETSALRCATLTIQEGDEHRCTGEANSRGDHSEFMLRQLKLSSFSHGTATLADGTRAGVVLDVPTAAGYEAGRRHLHTVRAEDGIRADAAVVTHAPKPQQRPQQRVRHALALHGVPDWDKLWKDHIGNMRPEAHHILVDGFESTMAAANDPHDVDTAITKLLKQKGLTPEKADAMARADLFRKLGLWPEKRCSLRAAIASSTEDGRGLSQDSHASKADSSLQIPACASAASEADSILLRVPMVGNWVDGHSLPIKQLKGEEPVEAIDLSRRGLAVASAVAIANHISSNTVTKTLNLSDNLLDADAAKHLSNALAANQGLVALELEGNSISPEGARQLSRALEANSTLQLLGLRGNDLRTEGWCAIFRALRDNKDNKIESWDLSGESISPEVVKVLAEYVSASTAVRSLNVGNNDIIGESAESLAKVVLEHKSLTDFCGIPLVSLRENTLEQLDLRRKGIGIPGAIVLSKLLPAATLLTTLRLDDNHLGTKGARLIGAALESQSNCKLKRLGVQNNGLDDAAKKLLKDAEEGGRIHHQVGRRYTFASPPPLHQ